MDLSKFSTEDLKALKANDVSKMSTEGLKALRGYAETHEGASMTVNEEKGLGSGDLHASNPISALIGLLGGSTNAFGHKAINMGVLGYAPQIAGAIGAANGDGYLPSKDKELAELKSFQDNNPASSFVGNVAGIAANAGALAPLMPASAATAGARIKQAMKIGTAMGAIANPGDKAGEINLVQAPERIENAGKGLVLGGLLGGLVEAPGAIKNGVSSLASSIGKKLGGNVDYTPIPNKVAVEKAAEKLGITDLPKAVLTDNPTFQKLESGLSQSGSYPAKTIRDQYSNLAKGLEDAAAKIESTKTIDSEFGIGGKLQKEITDTVKKHIEPTKALYEDLNPVLRKIAVDKPTVNSAFGALKRNPIFQTKDGIAMLEDQKAAIESIPELASLKEFRSTLNKSTGPNSTPIEKMRFDAIYKAVTKIRDNSINATKNDLPKALHGEVDAFINQHALADASHASNLEDINSIKSLVGNKEFSSPTTFLEKLGEMKESELAERASNLDVKTWQNLKSKFPSIFEQAKTAKINDMVGRSTDPTKGFSDIKFLKHFEGLDKELKDILFDPKMLEHIESIQTLRQAIPPKLGPSGTPEGLSIMKMLDPKKFAADWGIKKVLENAVSPKAASAASQSLAPSTAGNTTRLTAVEKAVDMGRPEFVRTNRPVLPKSNTAEQPAKGDTKWANDGFDKLKEHDDSAQLDKAKLLEDPKAKRMLIAASDLKPGSKAMTDILERIQKLYAAPSKH